MGEVSDRLYHFDLAADGCGGLVDEVGKRLDDDAAALAHARRVLCEVAQDGTERSYRVDVRGPVAGSSFSMTLNLSTVPAGA